MRRDLLAVVVVVAVVAMLAWWLHPRSAPTPPPETVRDPGFDVMLMAVGELPPGLLERMQKHVTGRRVVVGLPSLVQVPELTLTESLVMPGLETQAESLGARKVGVTRQPLVEVPSYRELEPQVIPKIAFFGQRADLLSIDGMPNEAALFRVLDRALAGDSPAPRSWSEVER